MAGRNKRNWLLAGAAVVAVLMLGGCVSLAQQRENRLPMVVGIVHLDRVLPELPEYRQLSDRYFVERQDLFKNLKGNLTDLQSLDPTKKQEIEKSVQKWDDIRRKFLGQTMDRVRASAQQVARDKHIDIVLVDAPWYPVMEQMAVDITTDVIIALKESGNTAH